MEKTDKQTYPECTCGIPSDVHGTACGWMNATVKCSTEGIIMDYRHPGFGKHFNEWADWDYAFSYAPVRIHIKSEQYLKNNFDLKNNKELKDLFIETVMRCQLMFPTNPEQMRWFDEGTTIQKAGDYIARMRKMFEKCNELSKTESPSQSPNKQLKV